MKRSIILCTLLIGALSGFSQGARTPRLAKDLMNKAEKAMQGGSSKFSTAEALFEEALEIAPDDAELNASMGLCQLNGPFRHRALPYFLKARAVAPEMPRIHFLAGVALQLHARWDEAIASFEQHKEKSREPDMVPLYNMADKHIEECRNGKVLMAAPVQAVVRNMGKGVNSPQADYGALVTADGSALFLTSRRPSGPDSKLNKATQEYFEEILVSHRTQEVWSPVAPLPAPVNTPGNDASVGIFNDGRTLLIYRDSDGRGDLLETKRSGGIWSSPVPLVGDVNSDFHESSAWFSFDRQWLYFVSDRPEGNQGGQDIYRSKWDAAKNAWGKAENLGPTINSAEDEEGVFVHPDGRTIYFSSKGFNSMGGYDVFSSRYEDGQWTTPENLGWPVNTPDDDLFFVLTADGKKGYLSGFRADGFGEDDIYEVSFAPQAGLLVSTGLGAPLGASMLPSTVLLRGMVKDLELFGGMEANIEMMDLQDASMVARFSSDPTTGEYLVALPAGKRYGMYVKANGFLNYSELIEMPVGSQNMEMDMDITMEPIKKGNQMVMKNMFFATASAEVQPDSRAELDQLFALLITNNDLRMEIAGHTDSDGAADRNLSLSKARAHAVRELLVARGIEADRLTAVGYGDTRPIAPNTSAEGKSKNRRTEARVL